MAKKPISKQIQIIVLTEILLAFLLYATFRHILAVTIMIIGVAFFTIAWFAFKKRFSHYDVDQTDMLASTSETTAHGTAASALRIGLACMIILTLVVGFYMVSASFRGISDHRMIWAFQEDEGWICDLYDKYVSQKVFDLGDDWGYTYGSFNLMTVSFIARALNPIIRMNGIDCIVINRLLLVAALLGTAWVIFLIGKRIFNSPVLGAVAAGLLLTNAKVLEITLASNYPDTFHMLFLTIAAYFIALILFNFNARNAFLATLFTGIGISIKYMGIPLIIIIILVFRFVQEKTYKIDLSAFMDRKFSLPRKKKNKMSPIKYKLELRKQYKYDLLFFIAFVLISQGIAFFAINPYYAIHFSRFVSQMGKIASLYANPALMNNLPSSAVNIPGVLEWWNVVTNGGSPDKFLFISIVVVFCLMALVLWKHMRQFELRDTFIVISFIFTVLWVVFVVWRSKFAFFHYLLPVIPSIYIVACALPLYINDLVSSYNLRKIINCIIVGLFIVALIIPLLFDMAKKQGSHFYNISISESRFDLSYRMLKDIRDMNSITVQVGEWLKQNCPDARSLITNETNFYYPSSIKDIKYWNRGMSIQLLFRTMPDLLIASDYFINMYTDDYNNADIQKMQPEQRIMFLRAREFYSLVKDKPGFLNYKEIYTFQAPAGWNWKRLHIYKREGPKDFSQYINSVSGPTLMQSPNGKDVFTSQDFMMPDEVYLAAYPGNPIPSQLAIQLADPVSIKGVGFVWFSADDHPISAEVQGFKNDKMVFQTELPILSADGLPYSWVKVDGTVDKIVLIVNKFKGQQRMLIRRMFLDTSVNNNK